MALRNQPSDSAQSLSVGNIVSVALQACQINGGPYLLISLLIHALLIVILIVAGLFIVVAAVTIPVLRESDLLLTLAVLTTTITAIAIGLLAFGCYLAGGALLSRLIFKVIQEQSEPPVATGQRIFSQIWTYTKATFWLGLALLITYIGAGLIAGFVVYLLYIIGSPLLSSGLLSSSASLAIVAILVVLTLLIFLLFLIVIYYVTARLLFVDIILALEEGVTSLQSLRRSWQLTQGQALRIITVLFIYTVIVIPPSLLTTVANFILPIGSFALTIVLLILWQGVKAVTYYDLRSRNEGLNFDLQATAAYPKRFLRHVCLQTPESVELDFALGGIGSRGLAWVIDRTIIFVSLTILGLITAYIYAYAVLPTIVENLGANFDTINLWALAIAVLLYFVVTNGYFIAFETSWHGQTPGKRLAKIRVVRDNGQPIGLREASLRSLLEPVDFSLLFLGAFLIAFSRSEKRLGDFVAGTLVIQDEQVRGQETSIVIPKVSESTKTTAQALLNQGNIAALMPDQYVTIRNFLKNRSQLNPTARSQAGAKLATQVQAVVFAEDQSLSVEVSAEEFLEAVYLAYRRNTQN
jgi:uncharacterized RDD family membrane protein YckC